MALEHMQPNKYPCFSPCNIASLWVLEPFLASPLPWHGATASLKSEVFDFLMDKHIDTLVQQMIGASSFAFDI